MQINTCFHLKKTAAELYWLLREAYVEFAPLPDTCERWFQYFKSGDFNTRQEGRQGTWKTAKKIRRYGMQAFLDKVICKHRNNSPSNWALINNLFPIS